MTVKILTLLPIALLSLSACGDDPDLDLLCGFPAQELEKTYVATTTCGGNASATIRVIDLELDSTGALGDTEEFVTATVEAVSADPFYSEAFFSACNERETNDRGTFSFDIGSGADVIECLNVRANSPGEDVGCRTADNNDAGCTIRIDEQP